MTTEEIMLYIVLPVGLVAVFLSLGFLFFYFVHSLKTKYRKCKTSYRVLCKNYFKALNLIPSLIQSIELSEELRDSFEELYKTYKSKDLDTIEVEDLVLLVNGYHSLIKKIDESDMDALLFVEEALRLAKFSVPFYNHNVLVYMNSKNHIFTRTIARILKLEDVKKFDTEPFNDRYTTINIKL